MRCDTRTKATKLGSQAPGSKKKKRKKSTFSEILDQSVLVIMKPIQYLQELVVEESFLVSDLLALLARGRTMKG